MRRSLLLAILVLPAACSGPSAETTVTSLPTTVVDTTSATSTSMPTTTTAFPSFEAEDVPTLALFLTAIEAGVEGTGHEGAAYEEPVSLINTGVLFCGLLDEGFAPIDVLRGWVAALSVDGATPTEDDLLLGGVVLGAAVRFVCPEYLDDLAL